MGEKPRIAMRTFSPTVWIAIWTAGALAVLGLTVGGVWLARRGPPELPVETLQSGPVELPVPALPSPDVSFNGTGMAVLTDGVGRDVAVDGQGRIVVLGGAEVSGNPRVAVWRLTSAGRMDTAFGAGGVALVPSTFPSGTANTMELGRALALDGEGRLVIAGYTQDPQGWLRVAVWRMTPDGLPDKQFHGDGRVVFAGGGEAFPDYTGKAVAIDANGRIVIVGSSRPLVVEGQTVPEYLAVWRLTDSGQMDTSFHGSGTLTVPDTRGNALALDGAGRILVAGATLVPRGGWTLAVWRFLADGSADPRWNEGTVLTPRTAEGEAVPAAGVDLAVAPDGKVVVLGALFNPQHLSDEDDNGIQQVGLWRFLADGTADPGFAPAAGGVAVISGTAGGRGPKAGDFGRALALDSLGRIVVAGASRDRQGRRLLAVWRLTPSGAADRAWGPNGVSVQGRPPAPGEEPNAVAGGMTADPQGRVLVAGAVSAGEKTYLAVWRIKP